jgi:hypothetical protein
MSFDPALLTLLVITGVYALGLLWRLLSGKEVHAAKEGVTLLLIGIGGCFAFTIYTSVSLAWTLSTAFAAGFLLSWIFLITQIVQRVGSLMVMMAFVVDRDHRPMLAFTGTAFYGLALIAGVLILGSAFRTSSSEREADLLQKSDEYQTALSRRNAAAEKVDALAVPVEEYNNAVRNKNAAEASLTKVYTSNGQFVSDWYNCTPKKDRNGRSFDTYAKQACGQAAIYKKSIAESDQIIDQYRAYLAAKERADELMSTPLPSAVNSAQLPHITMLATVLRIDYGKAQVVMAMGPPMAIEFFMILAVIGIGVIKKTHPHLWPKDVITVQGQPVRAVDSPVQVKAVVKQPVYDQQPAITAFTPTPALVSATPGAVALQSGGVSAAPQPPIMAKIAGASFADGITIAAPTLPTTTRMTQASNYNGDGLFSKPMVMAMSPLQVNIGDQVMVKDLKDEMVTGMIIALNSKKTVGLVYTGDQYVEVTSRNLVKTEGKFVLSLGGDYGIKQGVRELGGELVDVDFAKAWHAVHGAKFIGDSTKIESSGIHKGMIIPCRHCGIGFAAQRRDSALCQKHSTAASRN